MKKIGFALVAVAALAFAFPGAAEDRVGDPYSLSTCPVSGEELGKMGDPVVLLSEGREVKLCCAGCEPKFNAEPAKYLAAIDEKMKEDQDKFYTAKTCPISGKELGSMGDPISLVVANRLVKVCCAGCEKPVKADPAKHIAKLDEAIIAAQKDSYKLTTCPVSGEELGSMGDPIEKVVANRLVKLCCAGCEKGLNAKTAEVLSKIDG